MGGAEVAGKHASGLEPCLALRPGYSVAPMTKPARGVGVSLGESASWIRKAVIWQGAARSQQIDQEIGCDALFLELLRPFIVLHATPCSLNSDHDA